MIEFRCEDHLKCVVKCALDISCFEMEIYSFLLRNKHATTSEISKSLRKDKSRVYRALRNLTKKRLVRKEYRILRQGGYAHVYKPIPFEEFREKMFTSINEWIGTFLKNLEKLNEVEEENLLKML